MGRNIILFSDNKKVCRELKNQLDKTGASVEMQVLTGNKFERFASQTAKASTEKQVILVFKNEDLKNRAEIFHKYGLTELSVCPWDTHYVSGEVLNLAACIIPVDNSKPRLNRVEIELSESCNLNCKGCFQFSNLVTGKNFADFNIFRNDLMKLREYFWGVGKIRLLGGEPLLNPDFLRFITAAREIFPDSDIRLVSNGLLIPSLNKDDLAEIKRSNCIIDISSYPPTQKKLDVITGCLKAAGVSYSVSLPINVFFKSLLSKPSESPDRSFNNCIFTHCHALENGKLAACTHQFYVDRLNNMFDLNYPADEPDEVIDIFNTTLNGWEINEIFDNPRDFCRYCSSGIIPFKWKPLPLSQVNAADWIVKNTFINVHVFPVLQKIIKPFEVRLRQYKQRPKSKR